MAIRSKFIEKPIVVRVAERLVIIGDYGLLGNYLVIDLLIGKSLP